MPDYSRRGHVMRVKWDKATNMFASFYADISDLRKEVGDETLGSWCVKYMQLGVSVINKVADVLNDADASIAKDELRGAMDLQQAADRAERREQAKVKATGDLAKAVTGLAQGMVEKAVKEGAKKPSGSDSRQRDIDKSAEPEVREALGSGRITQTAAHRIVKDLKVKDGQIYDREQQLANLQKELDKPPRRSTKRSEAKRGKSNGSSKSNGKAVDVFASSVSADSDARLAIRIKAGKILAEQGEAAWVEGTMQAAVALYEAKKRYPDNVVFANWLAQNDVYYSDHERAALIKFGEHPDIARVKLQATDRRSYELIWAKEVAPFVDASSLASARKTAGADQRPSVH